jgi:phosphatidylglycerol---prolipoprotein diacylglyceryl transferase
MAIGRQGCFLHGCCAGRPTSSRWCIWASDGRVGARRAPTQQLESLACLVIGLAALLLVLQARYPAAGTVFVGALAAYTVCRQILFPYRAEPRKSSLGRLASMIAAGLVLIADIIVAIVACRRRGPRPAPGRLAQRSKPGPGTR